MEAMITSVLEFIRDASAPGLRERLDLRTLVDDVVEDAVMIGNDVTVAGIGRRRQWISMCWACAACSTICWRMR